MRYADLGRLGHPSLAAVGAGDAKDGNCRPTTLSEKLVPIALVEEDVAQLDVNAELIDCPADPPAEGAARKLIERQRVRSGRIGARVALDEVPRVVLLPRGVGCATLPLLLSGDEAVHDATPCEVSWSAAAPPGNPRPRAGILFVDFEHGSLLQLTGRVRIDWDSAELERFPGARRLVHFELDRAVELERALPLRWEKAAGSIRSLRVVEKVPESDEVTSFIFESRDGGPLANFNAGQHLPIDLEATDQGCGASRTYSLSNGPGQGRYRISVKRHSQGVASRCLHDHVEVGAILSARAPAGDFLLDPSSPRQVVFVSAGVGLTPLVSMLHELVDSGDSRRVWFVHGARDARNHALADEVRNLAARAPNVRLHVAYSQPRPEDELGRNYDSTGRVDGALLEKLVPWLDGDFYLCGPTGFMASVQEYLETRGVPLERIRSETF